MRCSLLYDQPITHALLHSECTLSNQVEKTHSPNMCYDYHYNMHHNTDVVKRELNRFNMFCGNDAPFILPSHITNEIYHCPPTELHNEVTYTLNTPPSSAQDAQPTY